VETTRAKLVATFFGLIAVYVVWGAFPDPRITFGSLGGLTPDQVVAKIGPPHWDRRKPNAWGNPGWSAAGEARGEDGPLAFEYNGHFNNGFFPYRWFGWTYGVVFRNGRVAEVRVVKP